MPTKAQPKQKEIEIRVCGCETIDLRECSQQG